MKAWHLGLCVLGVSVVAHAQMRDGMPPVMTPPPALKQAVSSDPAHAFSAAYAKAGKPRMLLLWNRSLSDETFTPSVHTRDFRATGSEDASLHRSWRGAGYSERSTLSVTETSAVVHAKQGEKGTHFSERDAVLLEQGFMREMQRGGVRFVDRALAMRTTAANNHRTDATNAQLVEADALMGLADVLMEVSFVRDVKAPSGYGFDMRLKNIKNGITLASVYSLAEPQLLQGPGHWVAGAEGYEFKRQEAQSAAGSGGIGQALAQDAMRGMAGAW